MNNLLIKKVIPTICSYNILCWAYRI